MANNRRKRPTRNAANVTSRNGTATGKSPLPSRSAGESSSSSSGAGVSNDNNERSRAPSNSNSNSNSPQVKEPPSIIRRRRTEQKFPEPILVTARKFVWRISLLIMVLSCLISVGWSRIRQMQEQRYSLPPKRETDTPDDLLLLLPPPQEKQPPIFMRLWKRVQKNLVQELQKATFISIAEKYTARDSSSISIGTITKNSNVESLDTDTDTDPSNNSHKHDKRKQRELLAKEYSNAFTAEPHLTDQQRSLLQQLSLSVQQEWPDMHQRALNVAWGGPPGLTTSNSGSYHWWNTVIPHPHHLKHASLEQIDGGYLLHSYLNIMKWPETLHTYFPFHLCKGDGCPSAAALGHSLEWREKYQPWMATQSVLTENKDGWVYARGFSPPALATDPAYGRHAVIWIRPGPVTDSAAYFRCILHSVDRAVAQSLQQSSGRVGKFNVMVDGSNYEWSCVPSLKYIKQAVIMLQDHFPDRLGMVFLVNVSTAGEILWRLVKPLLTKEVREKVQILSSDPDQRMAELEALCEKEYIPDWLGGVDTYRFDAASYYPKSMQWSEEQGNEFMTSMPYHTHK